MVNKYTKQALGYLQQRQDMERERKSIYNKVIELRREMYNLTTSINETQKKMDNCIIEMSKRSNYKLNPIAIKTKK